VIDLRQLATRPGLVVADRSGVSARELDAPEGGEWTVLVGPEGGLADEELALTAAAPRLALGRYVLRAAVAPVVAAALLAERAALLRPE
jgi:16S rRNA (uracil1498-N3)-methyltransferase